MTTRRFVVGLAVMALVATACGDGAADQSVVGPASAEISPTGLTSSVLDPSSTTTTTSAALTTSAPPAAARPEIAALTSGRGDDESLEIGVWFSSNPFEAGDVRLLIGTDSDESYPGAGDPVLHIDGWATVVDDGIVLIDDGTVIADDATINEWLSWTGPGELV